MLSRHVLSKGQPAARALRGDRTYLMIVENERVKGKVKQRALHSLGRLDVLQKTG